MSFKLNYPKVEYVLLLYFELYLGFNNGFRVSFLPSCSLLLYKLTMLVPCAKSKQIQLNQQWQLVVARKTLTLGVSLYLSYNLSNQWYHYNGTDFLPEL